MSRLQIATDKETPELVCKVKRANPLPVITWLYQPWSCHNSSCLSLRNQWTSTFPKVSNLIIKIDILDSSNWYIQFWYIERILQKVSRLSLHFNNASDACEREGGKGWQLYEVQVMGFERNTINIEIDYFITCELMLLKVTKKSLLFCRYLSSQLLTQLQWKAD